MLRFTSAPATAQKKRGTAHKLRGTAYPEGCDRYLRL